MKIRLSFKSPIRKSWIALNLCTTERYDCKPR